MPKVQLMSQVAIDTEKVLEGVNQLETPELERFAEQVNALVARRKAPSLPQREAELLQKINQGVPAEVRARYRELTAHLEDEAISAAEHAELLQLIDLIELSDAERLRHMIELATLRGISVDDLATRLGIRQPNHA